MRNRKQRKTGREEKDNWRERGSARNEERERERERKRKTEIKTKLNVTKKYRKLETCIKEI